ncbi:hypothetical protein ACVIQY_001032 [Bradyrhizobium sp. USDA 3051]
MAERFGAQGAAGTREPHHREIAGAAAEIRNQHGRIAFQPAGEGERRAHGFVDIAGVAGAEALERGPVALHRQRFVGIAPGEADGAADCNGGRLEAEFIAAMPRQRPQERRQNILKLVALPEHLGGVEAGACGKGLERLEEAVDMASFQELLDRPRAAFSLGAGSRPVFPETQRRHEDAVALSAMVEADGLDPAVVRRKGHDRIAGPKIDADRDDGRGARHEPL